jgi:hypothetical protein
LAHPPLFIVPDFGLDEQEANELVRTLGGRVYALAGGALLRGRSRTEPSEVWDTKMRRWCELNKADAPRCFPELLSEREAERIMWPEFYRCE